MFGLSNINKLNTAKFIDSSCRLKSKISDSLDSEMNVAITSTMTWAEKRALRKEVRKIERTHNSRSDKEDFNSDPAHQLANRIKELTKQF